MIVIYCSCPMFEVGPDRNSGGILAGTGSGPVPVYLAGTRPEPRIFSCWIKEAKRTVELIYILKSENVQMLFVMKYNLRYLKGGGGGGGFTPFTLEKMISS